MDNVRELTKKEYAQRMDRVRDYIRNHLDEDLSLETLADIACFSKFHFHRIFSGMIGESVKSHVRRLRLERSAKHLEETDRQVTLIAFEAGFESHESFTRSFNKMFGVSPSCYRKASRIVQQNNQIDYWKEIAMHVEIAELEAMEVIFVRHQGPYIECGKAWDALCGWAGPKGLLTPESTFLGLSYDDPKITPADKLCYEACMEVKTKVDTDLPVEFKTIQGGKYCTTIHKGPFEHLEKTYAQLCGQWVPQNGHEIDHRPCMEVYLNDPKQTPPEELLTRIYLPLK